MKRLVLNMVCRGNCDSPGVGEILVGMKNNFCILPLFLRDVGKYYWNRRTVYLEICLKQCIKNNLIKPLKFFDLEKFLCGASRGGNLETVKFLVENGADIHVDEDYPLRMASKYGHFDVVKYLVEHGADVYARNNYAVAWAFSGQIYQYFVLKRPSLSLGRIRDQY